MNMTILNDTRITIAFIFIVVPVFCTVIWWWLPKHQMARLALKIRDPKARADVEDNFRKTVGQGVGGAVVLIGAGLTLFQFLQQQQTAHDKLVLQQETMVKQQETARLQLEQQQKSARDLLISNQVSKGFEQLASKDLIMRLGGIYALEGVMNTSEQYRVAVLEALCAFVRDNTKDIKLETKPATDIQAALTVIGRRVKGPGRVDLAGAQIPGANLGGADLKSAYLQGANLTGANLAAVLVIHADLAPSLYLVQRANLQGAYLQGANLTGANMEGTELRGANLRGANLMGAELRAANLTGADLTGADLKSAYLGADLGGQDPDHPGANFDGADTTGASFDGACATGSIKGLPAGLVSELCVRTNQD